ncbi:phosphatidylinositol 3-kinase C2 domain-containing subunit gamma [Bombina bombina]|uniref:phosphatidylinositol 3-kinase C2 domain-containing subunit gamma n=1 Tax=Bombina bombina TaxID=8345 RepID=UPI00235A783A|nr:phosphatidylinositol 3-kinase C2 domain-containing subunit gamma [Bombina bombina]
MVIWDEEITLPLPVSSLPYESILFVTLRGTDESSTNATTHAWTCLPLYSGQRFVRGSVLLSMMCNLQPPPVVTPGAFDVTLPTLVTVQVDFLERDIVFAAPCPEVGLLYSQAPFEEPSNQLEVLVHRNSVLLLSEGDKQCLWRYRSCCNKQRNILPLVLGSAPGWDPESISAMHTVLRGWKFCHPLEALGLLNACFSDQNIREMACQQIGYLSNDELLQYLPQLVQAIKFEWNLDNSLVRLLLERSLQNIQIAHQLYWLLKNALHQPHYRGRFQKVLSALEFCVGKTLNDEFLKEKNLIRILHDIAEKVKNAQDSKRQETLQSNLNKLQDLFLEVHVCRLPQDPSIVVKGINKSACSYFKSNASPLKISFTNADPLGKDIDVIFKAGDDLRQDMLVLQIIQEMDRIWLREGLDLRIVTYRCLSTGTKQGLVQMVPNATTLAKIHQKSGLLGPLMDGSIKKWFSSVNCPQAEDNFFYSCAGWCVATFILGVCDRHSDNIMITDTGHVFHIDFGKFLGHAQKFGSIKRSV